MQRIAKFSLDEINPHIGLGCAPFTLNTELGQFRVKASSTRLECLRRNQNCVRCGIKGVVWFLECSVQKPSFVGHNCFIKDCPFCALRRPRKKVAGKWDTPHLNLYAYGPSGRLTLMTQDHIMPKHAGGSNNLDNLQTLCRCCNAYKGGMLPHEYAKTVLPHERTSYFTRVDGGSSPTGRLSQVHTPIINQTIASDCAAE